MYFFEEAILQMYFLKELFFENMFFEGAIFYKKCLKYIFSGGSFENVSRSNFGKVLFEGTILR